MDDAPANIDERRLNYLAELMHSAGHPGRLSLLWHLHMFGEMCVRDLTERSGFSQPTVSQYLSRLKAVGLVESERIGQYVRYRIVPETVIAGILDRVFLK